MFLIFIFAVLYQIVYELLLLSIVLALTALSPFIVLLFSLLLESVESQNFFVANVTVLLDIIYVAV